jgi:methylated-DNA-[protein]-cysteine S-methyltransferase
VPERIAYASISSPFGMIWLAQSLHGLTRVVFSEDPGVVPTDAALSGNIADHDPEEMAPVIAQFAAYFAGRQRFFDLPLDLRGYSTFQRAVLEAVRQVPYGATRSYRDIAEMVGRPLAARAVGAAVAVNRLSLVIPCHRIIKADGSVGFYAYRWESVDRGVRRKLELLRHEGIAI